AAALTRSPGRVEYWLLAALSGAVAGAVAMRLVRAPVAIAVFARWIMSAAIGIAIAAFWSGFGRHRSAAIAGRPPAEWTALDAWLAPIVTGSSVLGTILGVTALAVAVHFLISRVATFDWDFMVQKLAALVIWITVFAFVHATTRARAGPRRLWIVPVTVFLLFVTQAVALPRIPVWLPQVRLNPEFALDGYAAVDPSYRLIRDAMRPGTAGDVAAFYAYLRANSIQQQARVEPVPIDFVRDPGTAEGPKPHIFLFIVDSLRPDYLSTHNAAVTFTPDIEAFAADSYAFERAFTRYAGTGLAVPSIWAGGLLFHKEYVTPFAPMNALKKLLDGNGYRQFVAADHITDQLFVPANDAVPLMRTVSEMQHSFCATVDEMTAALHARAADDRPIFGHARTLDLHIGNIWSAKVPPGESYPGFFEPYAARVRAIDACFGRFIADLKQAGLYEESVIVLTSDHGDSLGEEGRWGHGFTIFPEVMRIPLIIRLPGRLRGLETDLARVSFATDITPTLYKLLGAELPVAGSQFGAPLFVTPGTDMSWRKRESYLVGSSYGPTYGLIQDNGRALYIADATYGRDYAFDLRAGAAGRRLEVADAERAANRQRIRDEVAAIAARYRFTPEP
ncbi:MAG: sulfatase-like hydrolase/transferase, partial [Acidobacteria bacterium]|nr:sulfatase-like hydrolase/transferase [Acidobacteriota bacterium]